MKPLGYFFACSILALACLPVAAIAADNQQTPEKPEKTRLQCWVDLYRGEPVSYHAVLGDLAGVRVVYLGESHGLTRHHEIQERIVTDLAKRGVPLVLALEQMEAIYQTPLDLYVLGTIDFEELAQMTDWKNRWSGYENYRGVLEAARKADAPILALNARRETIRQVARSGGVDRLDPELRKELPEEIQLDDPPYEHLLNLRLAVHKMATPERLRPMLEAQIARDETMASALSKFLQSEQGRGRTAIVLCGGVHCSHGLATVDRVRRRMPGVTDRIILMSASGDAKVTKSMQAVTRPITITHEQLRKVERPVADYLHVISRKQ
ncbi:MAG: ChaN family lipoprotein [Pirellulales bacterium]|nr:ChaN family lipoprotein [Pirellulales bacterium]